MRAQFMYGKLAEKENFVDRVQERAMLKTWLSSGINVMIISPRRWGKSSLVKTAMDELTAEDKTIRVCHLDAFSIRTEEEFHQRFAAAIIDACSSEFEKKVSDIRQFIENIVPGVTFQTDATNSISFDFRLRLPERNKDELLNLPEKIAAKKGIRLIICIDEFQHLSELSGYKELEARMRGIWQHQQHVSYCLYGSKRHMMTEIFNNSANPFYRFGQLLFLQKIPKQEWVPFIVDRFEQSGKEISAESAGQICDWVQCHSWYVQQLCFFVWTNTTGQVTQEILQRSLTQLISTNEPMFQNDVDELTTPQVAMLKAIRDGQQQLNAAATVEKYQLGNGQTITRNKRILVERDFIEQTAGKGPSQFCDPIFELWFRQNFKS